MATQNTYVKTLTVRVGPIMFTGSLVPVTVNCDKETPYVQVSPAGKRVKQRYEDEDGNLLWPNELQYGRLDPDEPVKKNRKVVEVIDRETVKAAQESKTEGLTQNHLDFSVHSADTANKVFPSDNTAYVVYPTDNTANKNYYDVIHAMVASGEVTLMTYGLVRVSEATFRLVSWNGSLVLQRITSPESIRHNSPQAGSVEPKSLDKVMMVAKSLITEFDPDSYVNQRKARLKAVVGEVSPAVYTPVEEETSHELILDQLISMIGESE